MKNLKVKWIKKFPIQIFLNTMILFIFIIYNPSHIEIFKILQRFLDQSHV
jgi:hypothetical protein